MGTLASMPFLMSFFMQAVRRARRGFKLPATAGPRCREAGASIVEFPLVAVPLLLVGLGSIEVAHWLLVRQALSLALMQAARAGATDHGRPATMEAAFEHALLPLFPGGAQRSAPQARAAAFAQRVHVTGSAPWQIEILSPTAPAFDDFADRAIPKADLPGGMQAAQPTINNNYQLEQHRRHAAAGWADGRGRKSGQSIFEANTLVLRLRYLHEPALPGIKGLVRLLGNEYGTYGRRAMALGGYLPITREIALAMDSHPVLWPMPANGKFIMPQTQQAVTATGAALCQGWWCPKPAGQATMSEWRWFGGPAPDHPAPINPSYDTSPAHGSFSDGVGDGKGPGGSADTPSTGIPPTAGDTSTMNDGLAVAPDDPACGVALCCVGG